MSDGGKRRGWKKGRVTTRAVYQWCHLRQEYVLKTEEGYDYEGPWALAHTNANFVQQNWRFRYDDGTLSTATFAAAEDAAANSSQFAAGDKLRIRFNLGDDNNGDSNNSGTPTLQYNLGGAGWNNMPTTPGADGIAFASSDNSITDGTNDSTQRLSTIAGSTYQGSWNEYDDNGSQTSRTYTDDYAEFEYCIQVSSGTGGNTYELRLLDPTGNVPDTPPSTDASFTVAAAPKTLSGSPSIEEIEASGTAKLGPTVEAGSASVSPTASGTIDLAPKVWLDSDTTLAGATEMTVTAFSDTSITFNHPSSTPTGSLNIGVENRNQGGGDANTGWLAVTVSDGSKSLSGSPSIEEITASGTISYQLDVSGTPSIDEITSSGSVSQIYKPSGTPSIDTITASGVISYQQELTGTPSIDTITASGSITLQEPLTLSGSPSIDTITASASIDLAPKVWLNATQTLSGATEMTVTAWNVAGTSITFTDPLGGPVGSTNLGVENRNLGGGDSKTGWIAVDITASRTASGTPEIDVITASGTISYGQDLSGTPSIDAITSTGEIGQILKYSGTPSIDEVTASGSVTKVGQKELSGTPNIDEITSTGEIGQILKYSGSPSIDEVTASGTVTTENILTLSGSPSINEITASASLDLAPIVWLNTTQTLAGATKMTVTAWNVAGTSITFTDPIGPPTDSVNLGVENRNLGGGEQRTGWIAVNVTSTTKFVEGSPSIDTITASGIADLQEPKTLSGTPQIDPVESSAIVNVFRGTEGFPELEIIFATGTTSLTQSKTLSGTPETPEITASGNVVVLPPKTLSGSPQIEEVTASGEARFIPEITSAAAIDQITASGTIIGPAPVVPSGGGGGGRALAGIKLRRHPFEREIEEEIREEVEEVLEEIEEIEEELEEIEEFSAQEVSRVANERLRKKQDFIRRMRKVHKLSERVAVRQLEARINEMVRQKRRFVAEQEEADPFRENLMLAMIAREKDDIEALLVIIAEVA